MHRIDESECRWFQDEDFEEMYGTECNNEFDLFDDEQSPAGLGMCYCCFCGLPLVEVMADPERGPVEIH